MKKISIISFFIIVIAVVISCNDVKREPGRVYMPDMAYSRAYETYSVTDEEKAELLKKGIHFSNTPVAGTIKRGELFPFPFAKDAQGDSTNYVASKQFKSQITTPDSVQMIEAERLFLVNCAICHGPKLDGNGPLYRGGDGPYPAAPANFLGKAQYMTMPEGQMFYSVTYGKNKMGSYASQLSTRQRWMVIAYIKSKQAAAATTASAAKTDSTTKK
ncbi:MAG TPA: cytochrome c [Puia sp.]|jgi:mono/diheme cytochrome c family protein|nr:cytochrome c [Puia sp.]